MAEDVLISPDTHRPRYDPGTLALAVAADLAAVLAFALIGRAAHADGLTMSGLVEIAWPFLVGVAGGWVGIFLARMTPLSWPAATMMLVKTVVLGCVLRVAFTDGNTPLAFVIVVTAFLAAAFFGWRFAARQVSGRGRGGGKGTAGDEAGLMI
jgi:hypothetical protein